jgi:hypothetical protein
MQAIRVSGRTIHAALAGNPDGLPLVLVNSLGTNLRIWGRVLPLLHGDFASCATTCAAMA